MWQFEIPFVSPATNEQDLKAIKALYQNANARRLFYISRAIQIITRSVPWDTLYAHQYGVDAESRDITKMAIMASRFVTIDFVSPIATAIIAATIPAKTSKNIYSETLPQDVINKLNDIVNSEQWNNAIHAAISDMVMFGTGFVHIGMTEDEIIPVALPFYTTVAVAPINEREVTSASFAWLSANNDIMLRTIKPGTIRTDNKTQNKNVELIDTVNFVPIVTIRNPLWLLRGTPYGFPLVSPAIDWSFYASGVANDLSALAHSHSFSVIVITGADADELEVAKDKAIIVRDPDAKVNLLMPDAKFAELDDIIDSAARRAAISCSVPPDVVSPRSLSNTGSGAVSLQYAPLLSLADRLRREITFTDKYMAAYALALMAINGDAPEELSDPKEAMKAFEYNIGYIGRQEETMTLDRVQSTVMALQNDLIPYDSAIKLLNPGVSEEQINELVQRHTKKVDIELAAKASIAGLTE